MRKRFVPLLLVMALALSLAAPAGAAGVANPSLLLSVSEGQAAAEKLHTMGLFQGVGTNADGTPDFALDRTPTRIEGVTILVRLLGKEQNARWSTAQIPFVDVPNWGLPYVRYSYANGYTKGTSGTTFGSTEALDAAQYLTLILRAMGYEDGTDFQWNSPWTLSNQLGFTDYDPSRSGTFTRGTAAVWAWNALGAETKDNGLLVDVLVRGGAIDPAQGADAGILTGKGGIALSCSFLTRDLADDPDYVLQVWGLPKDAPDPGFVWTSSNPEVATVAPVADTMWTANEYLQGEIQGKSCGTAVITATSADGAMSASCTVTVIDSNSYLEVTADTGEDLWTHQCRMWAEDPVVFTAKVMPEHTAADKHITWELEEDVGRNPVPAPASAANLEVLDTDPETGTSSVRLTFHRGGDFTLRCITADTEWYVELQVGEASDDVIIDCDDAVRVGDWMNVAVEQVKSYDENLGVRQWENSNPEVAKLTVTTNASSGRYAIVDGLKPGTTTITAILTDGRSISKTITVTEALPPMELSLPSFPCTVEGYGSSGELAYRVTITGGSYDYDDYNGELRLRLQGTVDYATPGTSQLLLYFQITDDATGEVMDTADVILNGTEGTFQYIPSGYSADSYVFLSDGHTYTLEFF